MKDYIKYRVYELAYYILDTKCTVRFAGFRFNVSKSTVHKDVTDRLYEIDKELFRKVNKILLVNKDERHIRGGNATKKKYSK